MCCSKQPRLPLLWLLFLILVASQTTFVQDANGAGVPSASVKVVNNANNLERTVTIDESGFYTITSRRGW